MPVPRTSMHGLLKTPKLTKQFQAAVMGMQNSRHVLVLLVGSLLTLMSKYVSGKELGNSNSTGSCCIIIIIIMTRRQLRSVATTLHDDRDPVPSSTPV